MSFFRNKRDVVVLTLSLLFLLATLGAVTQGGRERAKRMVCASHIKRQVQALIGYGENREGKLPSVFSGAWLQDLPVSAVNEMLSIGLSKEMFYCPANPIHMRYMDYLWFFYVGGYPDEWEQYWDDGQFTDYSSSTFVVAGYAFLLSRKGSSINQYPTDTEQKDWISTTLLENPDTQELVADLIMGQEDNDAKWKYNFGMVYGGLVNYGLYDRTNHLISDEEPAGGNIGFLDGHVSWRKWDPPTYPYASSSGKPVPRWDDAGPAFWW